MTVKSSYQDSACNDDCNLHRSSQHDMTNKEKYSYSERYRKLFTPRMILNDGIPTENQLLLDNESFPFVKIEDFECEKSLQEGKHADVFVARCRGDPSIVVAIKSINGPIEFHKNNTFHEIQMLIDLLPSDNVIDIYDYFFGTAEPCETEPPCKIYQESSKFCAHNNVKIYIVMEYAIVGDMYQLLRNNSNYNGFTTSDAKRILRDVVNGLIDCHELHYVHHDLKLENIVIINGKHKIIDFGLAKKIVEAERFPNIVGTLEYVAPEIITCKPHDESVDIWSLGVLLYEMIIGVTPFNHKNKRQIMNNIKNMNYYFPKDNIDERENEKRITECFKDLVISLLQHDPRDRISLQDILKHPWMQDTKRNISSSHI